MRKLRKRCELEREKVIDAAIAAAERLDLPVSSSTHEMLRRIYRSPDRWPVRATPEKAPRGWLWGAWVFGSALVGILELVLAGSLAFALPDSIAFAAIAIVAAVALIAQWWAKSPLLPGIIGTLGSAVFFGVPIWLLMNGGAC
jgi:hypothetical protein